MKRLIAVAVVCGGLLSAGVAQAAPVSGTFNLSGENDAEARVGADYIDFLLASGAFGPPSGDFEVNGSTGDFAGLLSGGDLGDILDLYNEPVGVPISIDNFVEFEDATLPDWNFQLTNINAGAGTLAACAPPTIAGEACTPTQPGFTSPFTLINLANGGPPSVATLSVSGNLYEGTTLIGLWTATFTTPLDEFTAETAIQEIEDEGFVQSSWAGDFTVTAVDTPVPEPASLLLMGLAFAGMGIAMRRRK
jgi:hypothetical protein